MIDEKTVKHIAKLARLELDEEEIKKYQKELSQVLDYIKKLKKADISKVEPMSHPLSIRNVTRNDVKEKRFSKNLIDFAPNTQKGYVKVKKII